MNSIFQDGWLANVETRRMTSVETGTDHDVFVALPASYGSGDKHYPLLVVLDANYCIGTAIETAAMQAATSEVDELIVIGVGTPGGLGPHGVRRLRDYTPGGAAFLRSNEAGPVGKLLTTRLERAGLTPEQALGGSRQFARFLINELLPSLCGELRVKEDDIGLAGHSAGGVFAVDLLLRGQHPFAKLIVGTFGLTWYEPEELAALEAEFAARTGRPPKLFFGLGGAELEDAVLAEPVRRTLEFLERLRAASPSLDMTIKVFEDETHTSVMGILLASGVRRMWRTGLSYTAGAESRDAREQAV